MAESTHLDKNFSPDERVCNWKALLARIGKKWAFWWWLKSRFHNTWTR